MRVATFNIAGAVNSDDRFYSKRGNARSAERVARARCALDEIVEQMGAIDVLALQEVDVCHNGADTLHQAEYLAAALDMHHAFSPSFDYNLANRISVTTGVATLSKLEIRSATQIPFPQRYVRPIRRLKNAILGSKRALHCIVRVGGTDVHVVNAHLTHDNHAQKEFELESLLSYCSRLQPCVLLGDFNTTPPVTRSSSMPKPALFETDHCFEVFDRHRGRFQWDERIVSDDPSKVCSYPSDGPTIKLDYVLLFSDSATLGPDSVLPAIGNSNHLPVANVIDQGDL